MLHLIPADIPVVRKPAQGHWILFLAVAVAFHIAIAFIMQRHVKIKVEAKPETSIEAYWVTLEPKPEVVLSPEVEPEPVEEPITESLKDESQDDALELEQVSKTQEASLPPIMQNTKPENPELKKDIEKEPEQELPPLVDTVLEKADEVGEEIEYDAYSNIDLEKYSKSVHAPTQKFMDKLSASSLDDIASQEAGRYSDEKDKLVLPKLRSADRLARDRIGNPKSINIDCNNALKQGLTALAGIMGGRVTCDSANNIQKFIDKRLEKKQ